jgi:hypothetical protein
MKFLSNLSDGLSNITKGSKYKLVQLNKSMIIKYNNFICKNYHYLGMLIN